jgi:hypothetical protein
MLKTDKVRTSTAVGMKAVVISDDLAFAAKACAILRRVGRRADMNVQWAVRCWQADALNDSTLAEKALVDTLDAHLIVLPARCASSLPLPLLDWLERWTEQRKIPDAALAVISDVTTDSPVYSLCRRLSNLVREHSLNLIIDKGHVAKDEPKLFVRFSREREVLLPLQRTRLAALAVPDAYRGWGINE